MTLPPFPTECTLCESGKVATRLGMHRCLECDVGKFSSPDRKSCRSCSAGEFVNTTALACFKCPLGRYAPTALNDECLYCKIGFSTAGVDYAARSCVDCSPGSYSAGGQVTCIKCLAGQYAGTRAQACSACPGGTFAGANHSSACTNCAAGKFSAGGAGACDDCGLGTYSGSRSSACKACAVGFVAATEGTVACTACSAGKKAPATGLSTCVDCPAGRAQAEAGQFECRACEKGKFAAKAGAATCNECGVGTVMKKTGALACNNCAPGQYQPSAGLTVCIECEAGRYQDVEAEAYCKNCARTYWSAVGSPLCTHCDVNYWYQGYFRRDEAVNPKDEFPPMCAPCPVGGKCFGGLCVPIPKDGYWSDRSSENPDDNAILYRCPTSSCVSGETTNYQPYECGRSWLITRYAKFFDPDGGDVRRLGADDDAANTTNATAAADDYDDDFDGELGDMICADGAEGPLCAACVEGYFLTDGLCQECSGASYFDSFLNIMIVAAGGLLVRAFIKNDGIPLPEVLTKKFPWLPEQVQVPLVKTLTSIDGGAIKVIYATVQIVTSVSVNLDMTFPAPFSTMAGKVTFVQMDFLSIDCIKGSSFHSNVYATSFFPLILFFTVFVSYVASVSLAKLSGLLNKAKKEQLYAFHFGAFLTITYLVVPAVCSSQLRGLNCVQYVNSNEAYLKADTSIDCNGSVHQAFIVHNLVMIFAYQMIPIGWICVLYRARDRLNPAGATDEADALRRRDEDSSLQPLKFLFVDLRPSRWIHEVVDMYRRILFISVLPLLGTDPAIRAYIGCVLSLGSAVYYRETMPYRVPFTNVLGTVAQYQILFCFLVALVLEGGAAAQFQLTDFYLGIMLMVVNLVVLLAALWVGYLRNRAEERRLRKIRKKAVKIEWAVDLDDAAFKDQMESIAESRVTKTHVLVYHYTSMQAASFMAKYGIYAVAQVLGKDEGLSRSDGATDEAVKLAAGEDGGAGEAAAAAKAPGLGEARGLVFSLKGPHELKRGDPSLERMSPLSACREAVFALSLPRAAIEQLPRAPTGSKTAAAAVPTISGAAAGGGGGGGGAAAAFAVAAGKKPKGGDRADCHLFYLPLATMQALAREPRREELEFFAKGWGFPVPKLRAAASKQRKLPPESMPPLVLSPRNILGAFQLVADDQLSGGGAAYGECERLVLEEAPVSRLDRHHKLASRLSASGTAEPTDAATCEELLERFNEARLACAARGLIPVYHYTSPAVVPLVRAQGFRMSTKGHGGVSFSTKGPFSHGLGTKEYEANVITDCFGPERLKDLTQSGKIDACFVYGADPRILRHVPGGNASTVVVPRAFFETVGEPSRPFNDFTLRPDRIFGCYLLDPLDPPAYSQNIAVEVGKMVTQEADATVHVVAVEEKSKTAVKAVKKQAEKNAPPMKSAGGRRKAAAKKRRKSRRAFSTNPGFEEWDYGEEGGVLTMLTGSEDEDSGRDDSPQSSWLEGFMEWAWADQLNRPGSGGRPPRASSASRARGSAPDRTPSAERPPSAVGGVSRGPGDPAAGSSMMMESISRTVSSVLPPRLNPLTATMPDVGLTSNLGSLVPDLGGWFTPTTVPQQQQATSSLPGQKLGTSI